MWRSHHKSSIHWSSRFLSSFIPTLAQSFCSHLKICTKPGSMYHVHTMFRISIPNKLVIFPMKRKYIHKNSHKHVSCLSIYVPYVPIYDTPHQTRQQDIVNCASFLIYILRLMPFWKYCVLILEALGWTPWCHHLRDGALVFETYFQNLHKEKKMVTRCTPTHATNKK